MIQKDKKRVQTAYVGSLVTILVLHAFFLKKGGVLGWIACGLAADTASALWNIYNMVKYLQHALKNPDIPVSVNDVEAGSFPQYQIHLI